jgi:serine protease Do
LLAMGGTPSAEPGAFVFSLDGRLVGLVVRDEGLPALVSAAALLDAAEPLVRGQSTPEGDLGVIVQPLTPEVAAVAKANRGAVVVFVEPGSPASGLVRIGDVIVDVNDQAIYSAESFRSQAANLRPGDAARVGLVRLGEEARVEITARSHAPGPPPIRVSALGLTFRPGPVAEVIRVATGSAAEHAGLQPGDVVTQVEDVSTPSPSQVTAAYDRLAAPGALLLGLTRRDAHLLLVVPKP